MSVANELETSIDWRGRAAAVQWDIRPIVDGSRQDSASGAVVDDVNPATERLLCQFAAGSELDVDYAVQVARRSFEDGRWSGLPSARRGEILLRLAELLEQNWHELALLDTLEMGKPIEAARYDAQLWSPELLRQAAGFADKNLGESAPLMDGVLAFNVYEPRGVVGAITPWNFPLVCAVLKLAPALAAGNTLVMKPSELTPASALRLAELAVQAGVPEGVFNVVPGLGATVGAALASHSDVDLISFTGSTVTGRRILEMSGGSNGKPAILEMGGKSPQVIFDDVENLHAVASAVVKSVLSNSGQVCGCRTRVVVHARIKDELVGRIVEMERAVRAGDPLDEDTTFGPLASPAQRDRVKSYIELGVAEHAEPVLLGEIQETGGCYVAPSVFDRCEPTMRIVQEEIFGPVLCIQQFETENEAVALANGTPYGLAASIWTRDIGRGRRLARKIKAGGITIHTSGEEDEASGSVIAREPQRASGFGAELGLKGLQSYSTLKSVTIVGT